MRNILKAVTFNVRCMWDSSDGFVSRMGLIYDKMKKENPEIVAFQEVTFPILKALQVIMPDYMFVGHGRNEDYSGEGLYIAIKTDKIKLIGLDTFWIAPNPYDKSSKFSDQSECPRICVCTTLYHIESDTELRVFNVHLDHRGKNARIEGIKCILNRVDDANSKRYMPTIILGDFNTIPEGDTIKLCDEWKEPEIYDITKNITGTFHGYGKLKMQGRDNIKIDYIYVTEELKKKMTEVSLWEDELNGHWLSDHYPICAEFDLEQ